MRESVEVNGGGFRCFFRGINGQTPPIPPNPPNTRPALCRKIHSSQRPPYKEHPLPPLTKGIERVYRRRRGGDGPSLVSDSDGVQQLAFSLYHERS